MAESDGLQDVQVPGSFEIFYQSEYAGVVGLLYGLTGSGWVAEDLAQDAFLRAHRDWRDVAAMESPQGWVRRVAINLAHSRWRRLRAEAMAKLKSPPADEVTAAPEPELDEFWNEVRRLPRRQAQALALHYVEDLPVAEIAAVLDVAEGTVKALLHQGRERLRRQLSAKGIVDAV